MILKIKLMELAIWYDPNKELLKLMPPAWVIRKAIYDGQNIKEKEFTGILEDVKSLLKYYTPFVNDEMLMLLDIKNETDGYINDNIREIIYFERLLTPVKYKKEILKSLYGKIG